MMTEALPIEEPVPPVPPPEATAELDAAPLQAASVDGLVPATDQDANLHGDGLAISTRASRASSIRLDNCKPVRIQLQIIFATVRGIGVIDLPDFIVLIEFDLAPI